MSNLLAWRVNFEYLGVRYPCRPHGLETSLFDVCSEFAAEGAVEDGGEQGVELGGGVGLVAFQGVDFRL